MSFAASGHTLAVGAGEQYETLKAAVAASQSGDTILVKPGLYENDFSVITHDLRIAGDGGRAHLQGTQEVDNGKGILDVENGANVIVENLEISGAKVSAENGAGIRHHGGDLTIKDCVFHDNQDGILAGDNPNAHITIDHSEFAANGTGDGYTHGVYVNHIGSLTVTDSYFHDTDAGHHIKSRADSTDVENCRLVDGNGTTSYDIDMPNGGNGVIKNNYIEQGHNSDNPTMVNYGGEGVGNGGDLWVEHNTFASRLDGNAYGVRNWTSAEAHLVDNQFENVGTVSTGNCSVNGNTTTDALDAAPVGDHSLDLAGHGLAGIPAADADVVPTTDWLLT